MVNLDEQGKLVQKIEKENTPFPIYVSYFPLRYVLKRKSYLFREKINFNFLIFSSNVLIYSHTYALF